MHDFSEGILEGNFYSNLVLVTVITILTDEFSCNFLVGSCLSRMAAQVHDCLTDSAHFKSSAVHGRELKTNKYLSTESEVLTRES